MSPLPVDHHHTMTSPSVWKTELRNIGRELQHMTEELRQEVDESYPKQLEEELTNAQKKIRELEYTLETERSRRGGSAIGSSNNNTLHYTPHATPTCNDQSANTTRNNPYRDNVLEQEVRAQQKQIDALKEEKRIMKVWLERGVMECQRVTNDVVRLSSELASKEQTLSELIAEKRGVSELSQHLTDQVQATRDELQRLQHEKAMLQGRFEDHTTRVHMSEDQVQKKVMECEQLNKEVRSLTQRIHDHEDAEIALAGVATSLKKLAYDFQVLNSEVVNGPSPTPGSLPGYYEGDDEAIMGTIRYSMNISKTAADAIQRNIFSLRTSIQDRLKKETERPIQLQEELNQKSISFREEMSRLREMYTREVETHKKRAEDLEIELSIIKDHMVKNNGDVDDIVDSIATENKGLRERNTHFEKENIRLKEKIGRLKLDWTKVDETRRKYRQLEREREALQHGIEKIEAENVRLREYIAAINTQIQDATVTHPISGAGGLYAPGGSGSSSLWQTPTTASKKSAIKGSPHNSSCSASAVIADTLYGGGLFSPYSNISC